MKYEDQYHADIIWLSQLVEWGRQQTGSILLAGFIFGGWIPIVTTFIAVDPVKADAVFVFGQVLACLMVVVGPIDVWYYDQKLLPSFFKNADQVLTPTDDPTLSELSRKYDRYYARYWWISVGLWAVLVLGVFVVSQGYFEAQGIQTPIQKTAYLIFFIYWFTISGLRSHAAIITIAAVRAFAETATLEIDPLHPDGLGGLGTVGELAIQTTLIISLGSLALPLSFQLASEVAFGGFVYVGVSLFVLLLVGLFVYPTYKMNRKAQTVRKRKLKENKERIRELETKLALPVGDGKEEISVRENQLLQLEIQRIRQEFRDNQHVQLYPLSIGIITRLASSLILPFTFIFIDIYFSF